MAKLMSQKEAAASLGIATRTLREWEEKGLVEREQLPGAWYTERGLAKWERIAQRENNDDIQPQDDAGTGGA